ncbi:MAG: hypothetical protein R2823_05825 [Acidimicrobiia bacterium]
MRPCSEQIDVRDVTAERAKGHSRVSAVVDGSSVWFESDDAELVPTGEAFGTAFLIPALHAGGTLDIEPPTDARWFQGAEQLIEIFADWWELPRCQPTGPIALERSTVARTGLCFTGGVDSFFTLLRGGLDIDTLIHVQGFDIPLTDMRRLAAAEHDARAIARALDIGCVVVRSNLREHPLFQPVPWDHTHGGALIAVGHLLSGSIGRLIISSSVHRSATRTHGTDRRIDAKWSSTALEVVHTGEDWWRYQKLQQIANEPLVLRHLRVCWEHRTEAPNCSQCEKCLRTMVTLHNAGTLTATQQFDDGPIAERLDRIEYIVGSGNRREYQYLIEEVSDPTVRDALARLSARSRPPSPVLDE